MDASQHRQRALAKAFWSLINPPTRPLAGLVPWWVLLETTGRRSRQPRTTPLAAGPCDPQGMWLIAAHGRHADYVRNLIADPHIRLRHRGHWHAGTATLLDLDESLIMQFNAYARGALLFQIDPVLVRIDYLPPAD